MTSRGRFLGGTLGVLALMLAGVVLASVEETTPEEPADADASVKSVAFTEPPTPPTLGAVAADASRLRAQLARVEHRLRARTPAGFSTDELQNRRRVLQDLRRYRNRGIFPVNTDFPDRRVPYFVDRNGTLCALAYLIWESGHRNLVAEVVATNNNGRVRELASNPRLQHWLQEHGLTVGEASMIQPAYRGDGCLACDVDKVDTGFVIASVLGSGLSVWSGLSNRSDLMTDGARSTATGILGGLAGGATAVLGATRFDTEGASLAIGFADAAIGAAATALGTANLISGEDPDPTAPTNADENSRSDLTLSVQPYTATPDGLRPGLGVGLRF